MEVLYETLEVAERPASEKLLKAMLAAWAKSELAKLRNSTGKHLRSEAGQRKEMAIRFIRLLKVAFERVTATGPGQEVVQVEVEIAVSFFCAWWQDALNSLKRQVGPFLKSQGTNTQAVQTEETLQLLAEALDLVFNEIVAEAEKLDAQTLKQPE